MNNISRVINRIDRDMYIGRSELTRKMVQVAQDNLTIAELQRDAMNEYEAELRDRFIPFDIDSNDMTDEQLALAQKLDIKLYECNGHVAVWERKHYDAMDLHNYVTTMDKARDRALETVEQLQAQIDELVEIHKL
jgi:hypothetical protein